MSRSACNVYRNKCITRFVFATKVRIYKTVIILFDVVFFIVKCLNYTILFETIRFLYTPSNVKKSERSLNNTVADPHSFLLRTFVSLGIRKLKK